MADTLYVKQTLIKKLDHLPQEKLIEVLDFVEFLIARPQSRVRPSGNSADLIACVGLWEFEPGELDEILVEVETSRLMELEEDSAGLFD